jgi:hypothetical protein
MVRNKESTTVSEGEGEGVAGEAGRSQRVGHRDGVLGPQMGIEPKTPGQGSLTPCAIGTGAVASGLWVDFGSSR